MISLLDKIIITENYSCLWCGEKIFYVRDVLYDGIYLDLYCQNKKCRCRQIINKEEVKYELYNKNRK